MTVSRRLDNMCEGAYPKDVYVIRSKNELLYEDRDKLPNVIDKCRKLFFAGHSVKAYIKKGLHEKHLVADYQWSNC